MEQNVKQKMLDIIFNLSAILRFENKNSYATVKNSLEVCQLDVRDALSELEKAHLKKLEEFK